MAQAGSTFLVATPFGWAIVVLGGIIGGSFVSSKTIEIVDYGLDNFLNIDYGVSDIVNKINWTSYTIGDFFDSIFKTIGQSIAEQNK